MAKVIQPINPKDVINRKGIEKDILERAVTINDVSQNLTVTTFLNHSKGTFKIGFTWNMNAVTGNDAEDSATLHTLNSMLIYARNKAIAWRDDWHSKRSDDDENQIPMFPPGEAAEGA